MSVEILKYNPFALNTARAAWGDKERSIPSRAINTVAGALKDIYIKNPYDLTLGNAQYAFSSQTEKTRWEKAAAAAIICIGSFYTLMLYGSTVNLAAKGVSHLGYRMGIQCLSDSGKTAQKISEIIFLAGAVPLYGAFYALPKIGIEQVPKWAALAGEKIQLAALWIFDNALTPLWVHGMQPILQTIGSAANIACQKISNYSLWVFENCLKPAWSFAIEPVFNAMKQAVEFAAQKTAKLAYWIFENVLIPIQNRFLEPLGQVLVKIFRALGTTLDLAIQSVVRKSIECITWVFNKALIPCFNSVAHAASALGRVLVNYVVTPIGATLSKIAKKIALCANVIFDEVIAPLGRALRSGFSFTWGVLQQITEGVTSSWAKAASFFTY